jgi:hypothetical protein
MFPVINVFWLFDVYIFGLTIVICFFLFFWMLKKLSIRFWYEYDFFINSILWYFFSTFFFSRLFYIISKWKDMQHINNPIDFFIMSDYNFSLFWAIFWFLLVLFFNTKLFKKEIYNYLDGVVLSFLFIAIFWFIWSIFWGQVYGESTNYWIEIPYTNSASSIELSWKLFPLPIIYSIMVFILFSVLYILSMYVKIRGLLWYLGLWLFSSIVILFELFSWKSDMFKTSYWINMSQILAFILIIYSFYWIFQIILKGKNKKNTLLNKEI